uniref:Glycolipid transfer protein domain-containing protein n=1 Tax=Eutreptiella gymnastica TaxID=73025 RepID=A0A7S1IDM5_9EUGL|mmetsp:Transcript_149647/g.261539  ORF Transcript_149647/g.261539 Transcript_149647/m.261539 type:complete len:482 (+) Transcript_149647:84-1529(+)
MAADGGLVAGVVILSIFCIVLIGLLIKTLRQNWVLRHTIQRLRTELSIFQRRAEKNGHDRFRPKRADPRRTSGERSVRFAAQDHSQTLPPKPMGEYVATDNNQDQGASPTMPTPSGLGWGTWIKSWIGVNEGPLEELQEVHTSNGIVGRLSHDGPSISKAIGTPIRTSSAISESNYLTAAEDCTEKDVESEEETSEADSQLIASRSPSNLPPPTLVQNPQGSSSIPSPIRWNKSDQQGSIQKLPVNLDDVNFGLDPDKLQGHTRQLLAPAPGPDVDRQSCILQALVTAANDCVAHMSENEGAVGIAQFICVCEEMRVVFDKLGKSFAFFKIAVGDFITKIEATKKAYEVSRLALMDEFVEKDVASGEPLKDGSNTRNMNRMVRTLMLFQVLLEKLLDPNASGQAAMSAAYDASLAPIHPWVLRKSLPAAFKLAPTRNGFLDQLSQCHETAVKDMHRFIKSNKEIARAIEDIFKKHTLPWQF